MHHTIIQATDLKSKLEGMIIHCNFDTVVSFDSVNMYSLITFFMAVNFLETLCPVDRNILFAYV